MAGDGGVAPQVPGDQHADRHLHGDGVRLRRRALRVHHQARQGERCVPLVFVERLGGCLWSFLARFVDSLMVFSLGILVVFSGFNMVISCILLRRGRSLCHWKRSGKL